MGSRAATTGATRRPKRNGDPAHVGRPHDLDRPVVTTTGTSTTVADAILSAVRTGVPLGEAAHAVGIARQTAIRWRGDGQTVLAALVEERLQLDKLTAYQQATATFCDALMRAEAEALTLKAELLDQAALGGYVQVREVIEYGPTTVEGEEPKVLGRRVTRTTVPPDPKATMFWLERRAPQLFGRVQRIEHAMGAEGSVVQTSPLEKITEALGAIRRRQEAGQAQLAAIDTTATDDEERTA